MSIIVAFVVLLILIATVVFAGVGGLAIVLAIIVLGATGALLFRSIASRKRRSG